jgi:hypothetical protein
MRRSMLNYAVDLLTLGVILGMSWTGLVVRFVLPPGTGGRHGGGGGAWSLWSRTRHDWGDIHAWLAASLGVLLLLHVGLHWSWVCATTKRIVTGGAKADTALPARARHAYGTGALLLVVILLGGGTWWALMRVEKEGMPRGAAAVIGTAFDDGEASPIAGQETSSKDGIRGSMTLREAAEVMGMPVEDLSAKLSLPEHVSPDERLGRLAREYGFTMPEVRGQADSGK